MNSFVCLPLILSPSFFPACMRARLRRYLEVIAGEGPGELLRHELQRRLDIIIIIIYITGIGRGSKTEHEKDENKKDVPQAHRQTDTKNVGMDPVLLER